MAERVRQRSNLNPNQPRQVSRPRDTTGASLPAARRTVFQSTQPPRAGRRPAQTIPTESADNDNDSEDNSVIAVRDRHGEIEIKEPQPVEVDEDMGEADARLDSEHEKQRLADAVRHHQQANSNVLDQSDELLDAVKASLRASTAMLAEDDWRYETEPQTLGV
ncbi:uncharacterized protein F5Z01DRAFT_51910 [Emericellopsis atlantica]|uniref:Uncharacterized protein n=1 Tax=Emericellopsis atlantica TaxID=2614577 RepID=A0A9P7ZNJ1_9HYPO|nr:uncharacterized protein F5Z01DRAFT_51910 [Emericellopsis atlantica]KAG9255398.1 hypothetical protein F5Z01DRAFT_51910 [Emericellopsis atlantica]